MDSLSPADLMTQTNIAAIEAAIGVVENAPNKAEAVLQLQNWLAQYKELTNNKD